MRSRHRTHKAASYCSSQSKANVTAFRWGRRLVQSSNADPGFVFSEPQRRESHRQKRELSAALQTTSSTSFSGDITMSASIGSTDHLLTDPCPDPPGSFYTFSHKTTIKRFTPIGFPFTAQILFPTFVRDFLGSLLLMFSNGFRRPIPRFTNACNESRRDTSHLGPAPFGGGSTTTTSRGAFAFASTPATHGADGMRSCG